MKILLSLLFLVVCFWAFTGCNGGERKAPEIVAESHETEAPVDVVWKADPKNKALIISIVNVSDSAVGLGNLSSWENMMYRVYYFDGSKWVETGYKTKGKEAGSNLAYLTGIAIPKGRSLMFSVPLQSVPSNQTVKTRYKVMFKADGKEYSFGFEV